MCIIIEKKAEHEITYVELREVFDKNPDGWGLMYIGTAENGTPKVVVRKGLYFSQFWKAFRKAKDHYGFIHTRIKTHGKIDVANCHPYHVLNDIYLMHNGTISIQCNVDDTKSDTWHFVELVLKPLLEQAADPNKMLRDGGFRFLVEQTIGAGNKLAMMDRFGGVLFNEKGWVAASKDGKTGMMLSHFDSAFSSIAPHSNGGGYFDGRSYYDKTANKWVPSQRRSVATLVPFNASQRPTDEEDGEESLLATRLKSFVGSADYDPAILTTHEYTEIQLYLDRHYSKNPDLQKRDHTVLNTLVVLKHGLFNPINDTIWTRTSESWIPVNSFMNLYGKDIIDWDRGLAAIYDEFIDPWMSDGDSMLPLSELPDLGELIENGWCASNWGGPEDEDTAAIAVKELAEAEREKDTVEKKTSSIEIGMEVGAANIVVRSFNRDKTAARTAAVRKALNIMDILLLCNIAPHYAIYKHSSPTQEGTDLVELMDTILTSKFEAVRKIIEQLPICTVIIYLRCRQIALAAFTGADVINEQQLFFERFVNITERMAREEAEYLGFEIATDQTANLEPSVSEDLVN